MRAILQEQQFTLMAVLLCLLDFHYFSFYLLLLYRVRHLSGKVFGNAGLILHKITFNIKEYSKGGSNIGSYNYGKHALLLAML
jgi:hypothetical protein